MRKKKKKKKSFPYAYSTTHKAEPGVARNLESQDSMYHQAFSVPLVLPKAFLAASLRGTWASQKKAQPHKQ